MIRDLRVIQKFIRYTNDEGEKIKEYTTYTLEMLRGHEWEEVQTTEVEEPADHLVVDTRPSEGEK